MPKGDIHDMFTYTLEQLGTILQEFKVVGEPIRLSRQETLVPISRVSFGFGTGGLEYGKKEKKVAIDDPSAYPFGGLGVGGVSMRPEAFLYIEGGTCSFIKIDRANTTYEKAFDLLLSIIKKKAKTKGS